MSTGDVNFSPPDPLLTKSVAALVRAFVQFLCGAGFIAGTTFSDEQLLAVASAVVFIATYGWSYMEKRHARRLREMAAITSANRSAAATIQAGQPVAVVVTTPKPADQVP